MLTVAAAPALAAVAAAAEGVAPPLSAVNAAARAAVDRASAPAAVLCN